MDPHQKEREVKTGHAKHQIWQIPLILGVCTAMIFCLIRWGLGFNGLYGQDSHEYLRYSVALFRFFQTGTDPGDYLWPVGYPLGGAIFSLLSRSPGFSLQLISFLSWAASMGILFRLLRQEFGAGPKEAAIYVMLCLGLSPFFFRAGIICMSDMAGAFLILLTFYQGLRYYRSEKIVYLLSAVFFMCLSLLIRYPAIVPLFPVGLFLLFLFGKRFKGAYLPLIILIAFIAFLPHILIRWEHPLGFTSHSWKIQWSLKHFFSRSFSTGEGHFTYRLPNLLYMFSNLYHPGYIWPGLILVFFFKRDHFRLPPARLAGAMILLYALFLAGIPYQNQRFFLLSFPLVIFILYPAFNQLIQLLNNKTPKWFAWILLAGMLLSQAGLGYYVLRPTLERNRLEKDVAAYLIALPPGKLYTFDLDVALRTYQIPQEMINLYESRIDNFPSQAMVLFNPTKFGRQWSGQNPMINWMHLKESETLRLLHSFKDGWELYEVE